MSRAIRYDALVEANRRAQEELRAMRSSKVKDSPRELAVVSFQELEAELKVRGYRVILDEELEESKAL